MAWQSQSVVFVLFLVLAGAATLFAGPLLHRQLSDFPKEEVEFLGKFAVDEYNKLNNGTFHLYLVEVVGGDILFLYGPQIWYLTIKAANCSQGGAQALYKTEIADNIVIPGQIQAYGRDFTSGPFYKIT